MSRWKIVGDRKVRILRLPHLRAEETEGCLAPGEEFEVAEELVGSDRTFLRLRDGRGFVSDRSRKAERLQEVVAQRLDEERVSPGGAVVKQKRTAAERDPGSEEGSETKKPKTGLQQDCPPSRKFTKGQRVVIKQKTKETSGTVAEVNRTRAVVEVCEGGEKRKVRVPFGMLEAETNPKRNPEVPGSPAPNRAFSAGQCVIIKQKTKETNGTVIKVNPTRAVVEVCEDGKKKTYSVPFGMLEVVAHATPKKAALKSAQRATPEKRPKARAKPKAKAALQARAATPSTEDDGQDDEEYDDESSDDDEKAHRRGWNMIKQMGMECTLMDGMWDHRDLIFMGRRDC